MTEGGLRDEIWSSVNYLLSISTSLICGKRPKGRQGIVWSEDMQGVLGPEMSGVWGARFKVSGSIVLLQ